jgi:hypothetical protein
MKYPRRRGFVHMWAAIMVLVFIGLLGLALDHGYGYLVGHQLQNAADASALAGTLKVRYAPSYVNTAAVALADANKAAAASVQVFPTDGDVTIGTWADGAFSPGGYYPNAVRVIARRTAAVPDGKVALNFGDIFGAPDVPITRSAIAVIEDGGGQPALLVLDPDDRNALTLAGSSTLTVVGGAVHVNSQNTSSSTRLGGNTTIHAPSLNIGGPLFDEGGATIDAAVNTGAPILPDPLAALPEPPNGSAQPGGTDNNVATLNPGYYPQGISRSGGNTVLNPGIYVLEGNGGNGGFKLSGTSTRISGEGVMLFIKGGPVSISAGAGLTLRAPDPAVHSFEGASTYEGITLFQARNNTRSASITLSGTMDFTGTFYFPSNELNVEASGGHVTARIIANTMKFTGVGSLGVIFPGYNDDDKSVYLVK